MTRFELHGLVLGLSRSGKRTLLQRLEGKEPVFHVPRNSKRDGDLDSASKSEESTIASAPYQAPPHLPTFDEQIQLHVQASKKVSKNAPAADFYVILIDPRHDRTKLGKYLAKSLHSALRAQGYGRDATSPNKRPFCLCLLRNFRDLIPEINAAAADCVATVSESDLTSWTMEILQEYNNPDLEMLLLQCTNTSLLNCFGLGTLHHFIYQAYVQRKQYDAEQALLRLQEAATRSRHEAPETVSYEEYLADIDRQATNGGPSEGGGGSRRSHNSGRLVRNDDETTATTATTSSGGAGRRKIIIPVAQDHEDNTSSRHQRLRAASGESSSTLPSVQQSLDNAKDALEAFLESDSDDSHHARRRQDMGSEQDDTDEEDFVYDDAGTRIDTGRFKSKAAPLAHGQIVNAAECSKGLSSVDTKDFIPIDSKDDRSEETSAIDDCSKRGKQNASNDMLHHVGAGLPLDDTEELMKSAQSEAKIKAPVEGDSDQALDRDSDANSESSEHQPKAAKKAAFFKPELQSDKKGDDVDDSDSDFFIDEGSTEYGITSTVARLDDCQDSLATTDESAGTDGELSAHHQHKASEVSPKSPPVTIGSEDFGQPDTNTTELPKCTSDMGPVRIAQAPLTAVQGVSYDESDGQCLVGQNIVDAHSSPKSSLPEHAIINTTSEETRSPVACITPEVFDVAAAVETEKTSPQAVDASKAANAIETPVPAAANLLSEAARAAIAAAERDFQLMVQETEEKAKKPKKKKKVGGEKKKSKREKTKIVE